MNVYDFDRTIFYKDSSYLFLGFCLIRHPKLIFTYLPKVIKAVFKYGFTAKSEEVGFSLVKYLKDYKKDITIFWDKNQKHISSWYLKQRKDDDFIISASPNYIIDEITKRLKVKSISTKVDIKTGKVIGKVTEAREKALYIIKNGFPVIHEFYSDSYSDTPAALLSERPFLVTNKGREVKPWPPMELYIAKYKKKYQGYNQK